MIEVFKLAEKRFGKGTEEWQMFKDFWDLCQKYYEPEENSEYWNSLIASVGAFNMKYRTKFASQLSLALFNTVEYIAKNK